MKFNINEIVRVKLTNYGRDIHRRFYEAVINKYPDVLKPKEDSEGWSEWQMWHLMEVFGPHITLGQVYQPFETEIEIPEPK